MNFESVRDKVNYNLRDKPGMLRTIYLDVIIRQFTSVDNMKGDLLLYFDEILDTYRRLIEERMRKF